MSLTSNPGVIISLKATTAITRRRFIDAAGNHCAAAERAVGVSQSDVAADVMADVMVTGVAVVESGGAVTQGAYVQADADGKAVAMTAVAADAAAINKSASGVALEAATATGQFIRVKLL